jgi:hypothetical protein
VSDRVRIISTGTANLASVGAAFCRAGLEPEITEDPNEVAEARMCVLPGVGAFGAAMSKLRERGLDRALADRVRRAQPLLAICLGFQLLLDASEESPRVRGLGIARGTARRFSPTPFAFRRSAGTSSGRSLASRARRAPDTLTSQILTASSTRLPDGPWRPPITAANSPPRCNSRR